MSSLLSAHIPLAKASHVAKPAISREAPPPLAGGAAELDQEAKEEAASTPSAHLFLSGSQGREGLGTAV